MIRLLPRTNSALAIFIVIVLVAFWCSGCAPLHYVRNNPIEPPQPIEAPELVTPPWEAGVDCGRFTYNDSTESWEEEPWSQLGGVIDTVEPGDRHPAVGEDGLARCRSLVIAPSVWLVSREARDRHRPLRNQVELWRAYSDRAAQRHQKEGEEISELLRMARRRQVVSAFVGAGVGSAGTAALVLAILLAR